MCVAKTKSLISFSVTAKLFCACVFAYAVCLFSHDVAHLVYFIYSEMASGSDKPQLPRGLIGRTGTPSGKGTRYIIQMKCVLYE